MREPHRVDIQFSQEVGERQALLPKQALSQALRNLLQNGLDASQAGQQVELRVTTENGIVGKRFSELWQIMIVDNGSGMSSEVQRRIGEPFFTTKEVGQGMGLGVFLTRNVIYGLGGELRFEQAVEGGTICRVTLPVG